MTNSAVIQLQQIALDETKPILELLRNAYLIASKLDIKDFVDWCLREINGYREKEEIPVYRLFKGNIFAADSKTGKYKAVHLSGDKTQYLDIKIIYDPIITLESLYASDNEEILLKLDPGIEQYISRVLSEDDRARFNQLGMANNPYYNLVASSYMPVLAINKAQIAHVFGKIRQIILDWTLSLEKQGILGEGLIFSKEEKQVSSGNPSLNITNFQGILGDVTSSNVHQTNSLIIKNGDFSTLEKYLKSQGIEDVDIKELEQAIRSDKAPIKANAFGTQVSNWMGKMVAKAAQTAWQIELGIAGSLLASALNQYYGLI